MQIGVKYCGGCNPRYDRKKFVQQLNTDLGIVCLPVGEQKDWDFVLVLCGCQNCCADHHFYHGRKGKLVVKDMDDYAQVRGEIIKIADT